MYKRNMTLYRWWAVVILPFSFLGANLANAQSLDEPLFRLVEEAVESPSVELVFDAEHRVVEVISGACVGCQRRSFLPAGGFIVTMQGKEIRPTTDLNGRSGTVIYNIESNKATSVIFFGVPAENHYEN